MVFKKYSINCRLSLNLMSLYRDCTVLELLENLPSIYQLGSDFVKQMFRTQIQRGGKVLLWIQVNSKMKACYYDLILVTIALLASKWQSLRFRMTIFQLFGSEMEVLKLKMFSILIKQFISPYQNNLMENIWWVVTLSFTFLAS